MSKLKSSNNLVAAVIFASVVIGGSLIFFGMQISSGGTNVIDQDMIAEAIDQYVADKQGEAEPKAAAVSVAAVSKDEHIFGNIDAEISLIEYSDFECPFCKRFHPTAKEVVAAYDGKVNWVYRHFPLGFHDPLATKQAEASECVAEIGGNDAFWQYADLLYETTRSNGKGMKVDDLPKLAAQVGVNEGEFNDCFESGKYADEVKADMSSGRRAGVTGTPGNIIRRNDDGQSLSVSGAQPFGVFEAAIDQLLAN